MKRFIKKQDLFNHKINLNFNNEGNQYNTIPGGLASIFLFLILISYAVLQVFRIYNGQEDFMQSNFQTLNHNL